MTIKKNPISKTEIAEALAVTGVALSNGAINFQKMNAAGEIVASRQDQINDQVKILKKGGVVIGTLKWKINPDTKLSYSNSYDKKEGRNIDMVDQDKSCPINFALLVAGLEDGAKFEYIKGQVGKIANCVKTGKRFTFHAKKSSSNDNKNPSAGLNISCNDLAEAVKNNNLADFLDDKMYALLESLAKKAKDKGHVNAVREAMSTYEVSVEE
jgi:hypothetical protein